MYTIKNDYIDKNKYSRPGKKLSSISGIVIHWTKNWDKGATALANRNYFNNLDVINRNRIEEGEDPIFASAHEIIDRKQIVQAIPLDEVAYHLSYDDTLHYNPNIVTKFGVPNYNFLAIEVVPINALGEMHKKTYMNLLYRTYDLLRFADITTKRLFLHNDFTGKNCHKFFVEFPEKWQEFKQTLHNWFINER